MWALLAFCWDAIRVLQASLGVVRLILGLALCFLIFRFYVPATEFLASKGVQGLPDIPGAWLALAFACAYLIWHLLRYAVVLQRGVQPILSLKVLDPGERYETYVALGNRLLRLYHVELENISRSTGARCSSVSLESYRLVGDKRQVDIRSKLKVANSEAEEVDLSPRGRVVFELCGVEATGADAATAEAAEERDSQTFSIVPAGSGTIRLMAEARNAPSVVEHFTLYVDRTGSMTIKPQAAA